jgi:hypothetical protein
MKKLILFFALWLVVMIAGISYTIKQERKQWANSIYNEANKDFVVETAFNLGISPDQVTQQQFNNRYLTNR